MIDTGNLRSSEVPQDAGQMKFCLVAGNKESFASEFDVISIPGIAENPPIKHKVVITLHIFSAAIDVFKLSQLVDQIPCADPQSLGHPQKRMQTNPLLPAFHFPYIDRVQIGLFGQSLLAHPGLFSVITNGITQDFELSRTRHSFLGKHGRAKARTPNMGLFCPCVFLKKA
jgi:hypothetical protein